MISSIAQFLRKPRPLGGKPNPSG